ncbi:hypothetical protein F5J12DRAFT_340172 [Pisolithus orientalis]|uniref:uncharacterized protein n=1 Tax=Pisolithus orientalis TaxID=936130 RepID=UPI0022253FF5|nr:uncharacterized protein F5J12DRAFT_340172 [Pisolithus orientalis]KAI5997257.1 hypothetical protein F5J12DRAFT_340172 [Pisolithus orientalis]
MQIAILAFFYMVWRLTHVAARWERKIPHYDVTVVVTGSTMPGIFQTCLFSFPVYIGESYIKLTREIVAVYT